MNYTTLVTNINSIPESSFTTAMVDMFIQQAEQRIYNSVELPALRKNQTATLTVSNSYLTVPTDFLYPYSLAIVDSGGIYNYAVNKDMNFIREAYPDPTALGLPKYYALFAKDSILLGPTPDIAYTVVLAYGHAPESIVTATNTWLGDNFDIALLNGALVEAARFLQLEVETIANYESLYVQAMALLVNLGDGKLRQDVYRSGQKRVEVR